MCIYICIIYIYVLYIYAEEYKYIHKCTYIHNNMCTSIQCMHMYINMYTYIYIYIHTMYYIYISVFSQMVLSYHHIPSIFLSEHRPKDTRALHATHQDVLRPEQESSPRRANFKGSTIPKSIFR